MQYLADVWMVEFLPLLQTRQKWVHPKKNLAVIDIVLVSTESSQCNLWPLGGIFEMFPDKRGFVCFRLLCKCEDEIRCFRKTY